MELSIVTSTFNLSNNCNKFISRCISACNKIRIKNYEIIITDDGSKDDTFKILKKNSTKNKKIKLIRLTKNFGQQYALNTGFKFAKGKYIFTLDSDLEESPENLIKFYKTIKKSKLDHVYGYTKNRVGGFLSKLIGALFYSYMNFFSAKKTKHYITSTAIFTKNINNIIKSKNDPDLFFTYMLKDLNIRSAGLLVNKTSSSNSGYTFSKKMRLFVYFIMNNSQKNILNYSLFLFIPLIISILILSLYYLYSYVVYDIEKGFTSIILSIWISIFLTVVFNIYVINFLDKIYKIINSKQQDNILETKNI